jgi:glucose/arabinose dehydrogenase
MYRTSALATILVAALLICCSTIIQTSANCGQDYHLDGRIAAVEAVQLQSIITGLSNPLYVTHANDGTNRLFILEQAGRIRVVQPGASTSTIFLDIVSKVLSGGERGLLGLAFHPQYSVNGRFFVYYTRQTDGALTVSEFHVSVDPNVANANSEIVFNGNFPIPHSTNTNHNGGCMQFGPDGFLYLGTGDGGAANDPPNNAQNINVMLGKILRIDVDTPNGAIVYSSPPSNPFFGPTAGLDEIYAFGMRNPWRFSFDRSTGQLLCGDVGQSAREEIDIVTPGGNYGWRVMEGSICNPAFNGGVCTPPPGSIPPIFDYEHLSGRCSITGGYSYRGLRSALPLGSYVYGDYCTGEIWQLQSGTNTLLLDTTLNITSFGEDESGEVYVVGQGGSISRLTTSPPPSPCVYMASPSEGLFPAAGGEGTFTLTTMNDCGWIAATNVDWITLDATSGAGTTTINFVVRDNVGTNPRTGLIHAGGQTFTVIQNSSTAGNCTYRIAPRFQNLPASGGPGSFNLTTDPSCAWQVTTSDTWITFTSNTVGSGNAIIAYTTTANTTGRLRKGTIRVADQVFSIKQKG